MKEHTPVMAEEVLEAAGSLEKLEVFVDATLGLAGHSALVLEKFPRVELYGFDRDGEARHIAGERLASFSGRWTIVADNFRNIASLADRSGFLGADAVLFDLGVSNLQLTEARRGFSFQNDGSLDMRMNAEEGAAARTAADILAKADISELCAIFRDYGEERFAFQIARGVVRCRERGETINTTGELVGLIRKILPAPVQRKTGGHPARRVFQALRIAVNDEMGALDEALDGALAVLNPGGKIIVISYHSLEDRMVKRRFKKWKEESTGESVPRKPLLPTEEETKKNHRSRSAKMRIFQKFKDKPEGKEE